MHRTLAGATLLLAGLTIGLTMMGCGALADAERAAAPAEDFGYADADLAREDEVAGGATLAQAAPPGQPPLKLDDGEPAPPPPPGDGAAPDGQGGPGDRGGGDGNEGSPGGAAAGGQGGAQAQPPPGPLLIYQAELTLAVHEVETTQRAVIGVARELGGYLAYQDDMRVTVRIPARRFEDAIQRLERVGDVVHRNVQAIDVTEEFRDLTLRLRNAEVVRDRLEALLARAEKVEDALKVQAELARVTETIEQLKGRLRYMQDRIAYSTLTVIFQPRPTEQIGQPEVYRLPFPWLDELGLPSLLNLR